MAQCHEMCLFLEHRVIFEIIYVKFNHHKIIISYSLGKGHGKMKISHCSHVGSCLFITFIHEQISMFTYALCQFLKSGKRSRFVRLKDSFKNAILSMRETHWLEMPVSTHSFIKGVIFL